MANEAYPRSVRIRVPLEFKRLNRSGKRLFLGDLIVRYLPNDLGHPRFGLTVSRRVGNAVTRNRVKRYLREAIRKQRKRIPGLDIVVIAKPSAKHCDSMSLRDQITELADTLVASFDTLGAE